MDKNKSIKVSPQMIEAGVRVLRESGLLASQSVADGLVVRDLLDAALAVLERERKNYAKPSQAR